MFEIPEYKNGPWPWVTTLCRAKGHILFGFVLENRTNYINPFFRTKEYLIMHLLWQGIFCRTHFWHRLLWMVNCWNYLISKRWGDTPNVGGQTTRPHPKRYWAPPSYRKTEVQLTIQHSYRGRHHQSTSVDQTWIENFLGYIWLNLSVIYTKPEWYSLRKFFKSCL